MTSTHVLVTAHLVADCADALAAAIEDGGHYLWQKAETAAQELRQALSAAPPPPEDAVELIDRLAQMRNQLPSGIWEVWTSNSFRRITAKGGPDGGVLYGYAQRSDGHGDLSMGEDELTALVGIINAVPEIIAALSPSPREKALEEALRPFARIAEMADSLNPGASVIVNVDRCRDARALLDTKGTPDEQ